jgi:phosphocarrier protein HPr
MPKIQKEFIVKNAQGLHARPAALFVQIVSKYNSNVTVEKGTERINGKSIMGILTLGANKGTVLKIEVDGEDAENLLKELEDLFNKDHI